ncbi:carboxypeptidase-like regulatory domain-containing protein [Burkholderia sp. MSMB1589WGS]|uniref:carboxypeptidase-like regulatory domain-containing protein n=1 Tax=Burkholderia sp. MSMB1589WGS TaxID=1636425 RepID=UPI0007B8626E|nr:carboxypeptidase-like regulatory domain-containing protein [Burkholderia sp. MSMB1589WGS]
MRNTVHRWMRVVATVAAVAALGSTAAANETLEPATQNGIAYVTGGVGQDEVDALRAAASKYNLRMTFASRSGEYLSDVDVTIRSAAAQPVLTVRTNGPFLYARLPAGQYRIDARYGGAEQRRSVRVPASGGVHVDFRWAEPDRRGAAQTCDPRPCPRQR